MTTKNNVATTEVVVTKVTFNQEVADSHIKTHGGVSKAIRALIAGGMSKGDVARTLGKRYQHVRNVLNAPIKKA